MPWYTWALGAAWIVLTVIDDRQTRAALARGYRELNPILGASPSAAELTWYTVVIVAGGLIVAIALPALWRAIFLGFAATWELSTVYRNGRIP
jgi:hypothetical protein